MTEHLSDRALIGQFDRGRQAEREGKDAKDNPWMPVSQAARYDAWAAGFAEADGPYYRVITLMEGE